MIHPRSQETPSIGLRRGWIASASLLVAVVLGWTLGLPPETAKGAAPASPRVELDRDDQAGRLRVVIDGREAIVYQYGADLDLPHYYPVRSPSEKSITVASAPAGSTPRAASPSRSKRASRSRAASACSSTAAT